MSGFSITRAAQCAALSAFLALAAGCSDSSDASNAVTAGAEDSAKGNDTAGAADAATAQRLDDLQKVKAALEKYHSAKGDYPKSTGFDGYSTKWGKSTADWVAGLVPDYVDKLPLDPDYQKESGSQYLYRSNGKDFKLIAHKAPDCKEVKKAHADMIDPKRDCYAYGYWTEGGAAW